MSSGWDYKELFLVHGLSRCTLLEGEDFCYCRTTTRKQFNLTRSPQSSQCIIGDKTMSLNSVMKYKKFGRRGKPAITPPNRSSIFFAAPESHRRCYVLNYVLQKFDEVSPHTERFTTYTKAHKRMNEVRATLGYAPIPQPQPIKL